MGHALGLTGRHGPAPLLAVDTCARRLRHYDLADGARPEITWHGPARVAADRPASEATIQAMCGLMEVNGRDAGQPRRLRIEAASVAAGILAAQGVLAARIGGQAAPAVQTSVLQAGLLLLSHYFVVATGLGDAVPGPPLADPGPPFRSADGAWFEIETLDAESWKAFWARLGVAPGADLGRGWTVFRWRYERAACSLPAGLHDATARCSLSELLDVAAATGVSLVPLRTYDEVLADLEPSDAHPVLRAGLAAAESSTGGGPLPLSGVRVLEATSRIQGPFAGMLLRMLGADVLRVQPPEGDYGRAGVTLHRGKASVQLDLGTASGRAGLCDLVAAADVFVHNWRPGRAAEWELTFDDLARVRPALVYAALSGWGGRPEGRRLLGTDFLVQAHIGLSLAMQPDPPSRIILCDLFGALVAAEGVLAGLARRQRESTAIEVHSSLLTGGMALQAHVVEAPARPEWGAFDRLVATADGSVMVSAGPDRSVPLGEGTAAALEAELTAAGIPAAVVAEDLADVAADPRLSQMFEPVGEGLAPRSPWSFG